MIFLKIGSKLTKMALFEGVGHFVSRLGPKVGKSVKKWYFFTFGSKSLKSDNLTFFRILRIIDENEGVILL